MREGTGENILHVWPKRGTQIDVRQVFQTCGLGDVLKTSRAIHGHSNRVSLIDATAEEQDLLKKTNQVNLTPYALVHAVNKR